MDWDVTCKNDATHNRFTFMYPDFSHKQIKLHDFENKIYAFNYCMT